jgi:membrane protein DedA with SNARE-associated domain
MEDSIAQALSTFGPVAVFLLLFIPLFAEDMIVIPAGVLVGQGIFALWPTLAWAYAGVIVVDTLWYFVGYRYGTPVLHRPWFKRLAHPRRLLEAKHAIERRGAWVIVFARFVPASRTTAVVMAGMLHMPFWKYALAECLCALITVPLQVGAGMFIAHHVGATSTYEIISLIIAVIVVMMVLVAALRWYLKHRGSEHRPPRARARWLRKFRPHPIHRRMNVAKSPIKAHPTRG